MDRPRVRQHVNPLSFRDLEVEIPRWEEVFAQPSQPLEVDIGTGHGAFLLEWAQARPDLNLVGLEIRKPMVERVQRRITRLGLTNVLVVLCNANMSFADLFAAGTVRTVYVNFPDPWFKKRHHKRRVMTPQLVEQVSSVLEPAGELRFMTDYGEYAAEVDRLLAGHEVLEPIPWTASPRPQTHREAWHESRGHTVERRVWRKRAE